MSLPLFTDEKIQLMGTCRALLMNPASGKIDFDSDTFSTAQITTSASEQIIRSGLGNGIVGIMTTDKDVSVNFQADQFSLKAKAMNFGGDVSYSAPVMTCKTVTASGAALAIDVAGGTPVAGIARVDPECYVMEVGAEAPIGVYGTAYPIDAETGVIDGFEAEIGKQYKVFYYTLRSNAEVATLSASGEPYTEYFMAQIAGYKNVVKGKTGTRAGWLYVIIPLLHFGGANAGIDGSQTTPDNTMIVGRALRSDDAVVSAECDDCDAGGKLAYYVWVPDDEASNVIGVAIVGGVITVPVSSTHTISEFKLVMADGSLAAIDKSSVAYELTGAPSGTSVSGNVITAGATAGDCDIKATVTLGEETFVCEGTLSVVE